MARRRKHGVDFSLDFFDRPAYLTVSGQLEAETFACALGKTYTFGPTFRAENSNTPRHLAEFWMIEPEVAFCDLWGDMELAEGLLKRIFRDVLEKCPEDMQFFNDRIDKTILETIRHILDSQFLRVSYTEAVEILEKSGQPFEFPSAWGNDLQAEHERYLTEKHFQQPVILYDYPRTIKPFYMRVNDDGRTVRAMDVLVPKVGEIIGGSQREERLDVLEARMRRTGPRSGGLLVVSRPAALRHRAARRLRPGAGAGAAVRHRHGEHPRRDPLPPHARQRGVLRGASRHSVQQAVILAQSRHSERSEESCPNSGVRWILRCAQNDGLTAFVFYCILLLSKWIEVPHVQDGDATVERRSLSAIPAVHHYDDRPLSNFIESTTKRFIEGSEWADEFEMAEIHGNTALNRSIRRGHSDARSKRGRFVG